MRASFRNGISCMLSLAVCACGAPVVEMPGAPTDASSLGRTITRSTAESVYAALADSLSNAYGEVPEYVAAAVPGVDKSGFLKFGTGVRHSEWEIAALTRSGRLRGVCELTSEHECPQAEGVSLVYDISPLYRWQGSDTIFVGVAQSTTWPPSTPDMEHLGFGAYEQYWLARVNGVWRVVREELKVIT